MTVRIPDAAPAGPRLPLGRRIELPGRGTTFVREVEGPPGAPTVVLLHGWFASGALNWYRVFDPLAAEFRVLAPDLRGHGRGIRSGRRFRIGDCADDTAAMLDVLGTGPVIAVGYSLGGAVAQLLWRTRPDLVEGLVLIASAHSLTLEARTRWLLASAVAPAAGVARLGELVARGVPLDVVRSRWPHQQAVRPISMRAWATAEMRRHNPRMILEAAVAVGSNTTRRWVEQIDVPTAVVVTTKDRVVAPLVQLHTANSIPGAVTYRVDEGHLVCTKREFIDPVVAACEDVDRRVRRFSSPA